MNAFISSDYIDHAELGKNNVMQYAICNMDAVASFPDFPKDYDSHSNLPFGPQSTIFPSTENSATQPPHIVARQTASG